MKEDQLNILKELGRQISNTQYRNEKVIKINKLNERCAFLRKFQWFSMMLMLGYGSVVMMGLVEFQQPLFWSLFFINLVFFIWVYKLISTVSKLLDEGV